MEDLGRIKTLSEIDVEFFFNLHLIFHLLLFNHVLAVLIMRKSGY
jgi:hypothetical protein